MTYWALVANPLRYDIDAAVEQLPENLWTTKRYPIARGDRVLIWRARGRHGPRGIIALGEVLDDPADRPDAGSPFWVDPSAASQIEPRVRIRYVRPPRLPLWVDDTRNGVLRRRGHDCLYLLRDVVVTEQDGEVSASGGVPVIVNEWRVADDRLRPIAYAYAV